MDALLHKRLAAELLGVFALVFVAVLTANSGGGIVADALASGLIIAALIAALGGISGAHFNPAVTVAFLLTGRLSLGDALAYVLAQLGGGTLAALLLATLLGPQLLTLGTPQPQLVLAAAAPLSGIVLEAAGTFLLVLVIFGTAVDERAPRYVYPMAIGLTISAVILAIGPFTGSALNPARVFGPALAGGGWTGHLTYWLGPLSGGLLAGALQHWFLLPGGLPRPDAEAV